MTKRIFTLALCLAVFGQVTKIQAQSDKNKKSRYYQNQTTAPEEFNVEGFFQEPERKQVEKKTDEKEYEVKIRRNEADSKYYDEKRVVKEDEVRHQLRFDVEESILMELFENVFD